MSHTQALALVLAASLLATCGGSTPSSSPTVLLDGNERCCFGRALLQGPAGQVAVSYPLTSFYDPAGIRLFTSAQLP